MLTTTVDDSAVPDYLQSVRDRIMSGIRGGMQDVVEGLSWNVADKLQGNPIVSRSGRLLGAVLGSGKVTETESYIKGTVSGMVDGKPLGLWLEEGTNVPASAATNKGPVLYQFTAADGKSIFTHGHAAFQVAPHPFLNPSIQEYKPTIIDIISARIAAACDE